MAPANTPDAAWFTRERLLTVILALLTFLGVYVCYLIIKPFIPPIAFALALAVATKTPHDLLRRRFGSEAWAAGLAVLLVALLIIGPLVLLGVYIANQVTENVDQLRSAQGIEQIRTSIMAHLPFQSALDWIGSRLNLEEQFSRVGSMLASQTTSFLRGSIDVLTQLVIMLFVLFFLYRDRKEARKAVSMLVPLSTEEADDIFSRVSSTIHATVNGSFTVAAIQAVLASIMYLALGVPAAVLWGAVTFIAALVPVFGTVLIWGPISLYLLATGSTVKALILVAWGGIAIGTIDNILYPYLVGDRLRMHTVPTFFSILGGITLFGPAGLILGPISLAVTTALLDVWWQRTKYGQAAEDSVSETPETTESPAEVLQTDQAIPRS